MGSRAAPGWVERVETAPAGRAVISALLVFTLVAIAVTNLPQSHLRTSLQDKTQPYLNAIGLDQNWGVFAPDPRQQVLRLKARIAYPDGSIEEWAPPDRNPFTGAYSDYRWRKFMENLITQDGGGVLASETAAWVARERRGRPERPTQVTILKSVADLPAPGQGAGRPLQFVETEVATVAITRAILEGGRP